jgi:hypothetical protein
MNNADKLGAFLGKIQEYADKQKLSMPVNPTGLMLDHTNSEWDNTFKQLIEMGRDQNASYDLSAPTSRGGGPGYTTFENWDGYKTISTIPIPVAGGMWKLHSVLKDDKGNTKTISTTLNMKGNSIMRDWTNKLMSKADYYLRKGDKASYREYHAKAALIAGVGNGAEFQDMYLGDVKPISPDTNLWAAKRGLKLELSKDPISGQYQYKVKDKDNKPLRQPDGKMFLFDNINDFNGKMREQVQAVLAPDTLD